MTVSRKFLDFDCTILAKLSDSLKDQISAKTFVNLQRRANHELRAVRELVQSLLEAEEHIRMETDRLVDTHLIAKQRKQEVQFCDWEKYKYLPESTLIRERTEQNFDDRRQYLKQAFDNYLNHVNRVGNVHLDIPAEDKYDPFEMHKDHRGNKTASSVGTSASTATPSSSSRPGRLLRRPNTIHGQQTDGWGNDSGRQRLTPFEQQLRPSPRPTAWRRVQFYYINSEARVRSRKRFNGAFNRSDLPIPVL